jgi:S-adenosylmethionine:tRNA-ribosyltransferase-isomerase (queuine synthetase)
MLSIEQCKKILKNSNYSDEEIREIRNVLYQLGEMLFDEYMKQKRSESTKKK